MSEGLILFLTIGSKLINSKKNFFDPSLVCKDLTFFLKFNGIFDFEKQIYLYSLNSKGTPGYDVITPIKINSKES